MCVSPVCFFLTSAPSTLIYTLSLHDALPISHLNFPAVEVAEHADTRVRDLFQNVGRPDSAASRSRRPTDRKSTRLNSSHMSISYAVFCLKKKSRRRHLHATRQFRDRKARVVA